MMRKLRINRFKTAGCWLGLCLVLPVAETCFGINDSDDFVQLFGLTFPCASCRVFDDDSCEVPHEGKLTALNCREAMESLLSELASGGYDGKSPSARELRNFLLVEKRHGPAAPAAFTLLAQTGDGLELLMQDAVSFFKDYPLLVMKLIEQGIGTTDLMEAIWHASGQSVTRLGAETKALIALRLGETGLGRLYDELSLTSVEKDEDTLTLWASVIGRQRGDWSEDLRKTKGLLKQCSVVSWDTEDRACSDAEFAGLSQPGGLYLQRVRVRSVLAEIRKTSGNSLATVQLLLKIPYRTLRTPETHQVMLEALRDLQTSVSAVQARELLQGRAKDMIDVFAQNDEEIEKLVGELKGQFIDVKHPSVFIWEQILTAVLLTFLVGSALSQFRPSGEAGNKNGLDLQERAELRKLRRFFNLAYDATVEDLAREYHVRARELHPDSGQGDTESFTMLSENYQKAKTLLRAGGGTKSIP
jgi:hypothetical protein